MEYQDAIEESRKRKQEAAADIQVVSLSNRTMNEVSADARYIVKHLWIIMVVLPFVLAILFAILKNV
jgi:hypothetical protein